ncbi:sorbosone dehydrogenase family protein [Caulobacter sp. 17J80-11]|nr:sorbosone dehydrogenase family protein [Caulobacter sp. 17J80-11]
MKKGQPRRHGGEQTDQRRDYGQPRTERRERRHPHGRDTQHAGFGEPQPELDSHENSTPPRQSHSFTVPAQASATIGAGRAEPPPRPTVGSSGTGDLSMRVLLLALVLAGCAGGGETAPPGADFGPDPQLTAPHSQLIPTVKVAPAVGWRQGAAPTPAPGLKVQVYASGLNHPRQLYLLPSGDVLVAETAQPPSPAPKGLKAWFEAHFMKKAGANVPSPNRITLLRDADGDGTAETRSVLLEGLNSPYGMALVGQTLYVADTDALLAFPYRPGDTRITAPARKVADLSAVQPNYHWTKNLVAGPDGALYVAGGSNSNVGEKGMEIEADRALIQKIDPATGAREVYASGLRNPVGMAWEPQTGALWVAVNERDEIGDSVPPDYMTAVKAGGFYGWPYSYWGGHVDKRAKPPRPDLVATAVTPDYALGAHTASLGLAFADANVAGLPPTYTGGAFVGQHGSWNRSVPAGYKVIFIPFRGGRPAGGPQDVLTGFLDAKGRAQGRPVGVALDRTGALLVADDVGNTVWRVSAAAPTRP